LRTSGRSTPKSTLARWCVVTEEPRTELPPATPTSHTGGLGDRLARVLIAPLLVVLAVVIVVFYVMYSPSVVIGNSMLPSLRDGDRALVTKTYEQALRGDVVVANIGSGRTEDRIIKRVIGVGGDTIEVRNDLAIVNGVAEEPAGLVLNPNKGENRDSRVVPEGHVYLMGDNRIISLDSRFIQSVPIERIYGKVVYVFWPISSVGLVE
jgi:signal peptidase I